MADDGPNYLLERQRLAWQIAQQRSTIEQQKFGLLEMADRKASLQTNIAAAERVIAEYQSQLADLEKTHGKLTDVAIEAAVSDI